MGNLSQRVGFGVEISTVGLAPVGSWLTLGSPITQNPVVMIFDNQSTKTLAITNSINAAGDTSTTWKTFVPGEVFVLDLRANHGYAPNYTIDLGTQFYVTNTAVNGDFKISYIYAQG